ncbi:MAG: RNA polymerase sigma factor [Vicinamibacteraceae bacterium]
MDLLLQRFAAGDLDAFETLFRQHQGEVYGWIVRLVRNPSVAEELTIEAFWRMHRAHARFDAARSFGAWARRIATNLALEHLKRHRVELDLDPSRVPEPQTAPDAVERLQQRELQRRIGEAFNRLSPKLRAAATLALVEEQPYEQIADALGVSVGTVKSRVFRAVRHMRRWLGDLVE